MKAFVMLQSKNMFKRKFRTRRQYVGRRRNRNLSRAGKKEINETETDLGQHETEEGRLKTKRTSASAPKLEAFSLEKALCNKQIVTQKHRQTLTVTSLCK